MDVYFPPPFPSSHLHPTNTIPDDTGVISATLVSLSTSLGRPLTTLDKSLITSSTALFALFASPLAGVLADRLGRKKVILLADLAFILGALVQSMAGSVGGMCVGRGVVGVAVGAGSFVAPLYIVEMAPRRFRGMSFLKMSSIEFLLEMEGGLVWGCDFWCFDSLRK